MLKSEFVVVNPIRTNHSGPVRWLASHLQHNLWLVVVSILGAFGNAALASAIPIYAGQAFNAARGDRVDLQTILWVSLLMVGTQLVRSLLQLARNAASEVQGQRLERDSRQELYASLLGKSMRFHDGYPTGEMMARATNDVRELALLVAPGLNLVIGSANFLIVPILVAPSIHPQLIWTPLIFTILYTISLAQYLQELSPATTQVRTSFGQMNSGLTAAIEGIETVKSAAQESVEIERFAKNARRVRDAFVGQGRVEARYLPLLLLGIAQATGLWHALVLFRAEILPLGDVVAYTGIISLFSFPVFVSLFAYSQVSSGVSSARRILELLRSETELDRNEGGYSEKMRGEICFENVTFGYDSTLTEDGRNGLGSSGSQAAQASRPALEAVSFTIEAGQTLALVGQTGSGKSTVAKLINRIYDVSQGQVTVDGVDVRDWNIATLRQQISIIEQDIFLFSRTIGENIAFGRPDATEEEIVGAAQSAQAHDFISTFPEGYHTVVGERGVMLSGGQRQRIALARAFLTDPAVLILDDSTSAIDSATEDQIQRAIEAATRGRTTILITHRLSQIRWADKIVVLRKGRVAAVGSHEELLEKSQAYRDIFARYS
ncbi:MAG: ABC transporter ATP-binding protein [Caldilineaceae bacterium]|nr:ABC transporter ATP-binding protein [Caldilineaceae bacterium]